MTRRLQFGYVVRVLKLRAHRLEVEASDYMPEPRMGDQKARQLRDQAAEVRRAVALLEAIQGAKK